MSINDLPPELLNSIFQFLSPPSNPFSNSNLSLYSQAYHPLTLVCKRWNEIATPLLYTAARLSEVEQYSTFNQTLKSTILGQHLKCLRVSLAEWTEETKASLIRDSSELLVNLGRWTPNLEELYIAQTQTIDLTSLTGLMELKKLVIWGARLELSSSSSSSSPILPIFPSLTELSLCGVKNLASISSLFSPSSFPSLTRIALCYSQLPLSPIGENFLSLFPDETLVVTTSDVRRSLGQKGNVNTLWTNRFCSVLEGYTDFGKSEPFPQHLQLTDIEGLTHFTFLALMEELGKEAVQGLENVWLPDGCWKDEGEKERVEEWAGEKGVRVLWEKEGDYMHESLIPESFVRICEEKRWRRREMKEELEIFRNSSL